MCPSSTLWTPKTESATATTSAEIITVPKDIIELKAKQLETSIREKSVALGKTRAN